jgi:hypothetical protein
MKKQRIKFIWVLPILILTVVVSTTILSRTQAQINISTKDKDATPIKEGVMSERQKAHSKLFDANRAGKKISETISQQAKVKAKAPREFEIKVLPPLPFLSPVGQIKSNYEFLTEMTADSDAVLVGVVKEKNSQLTESGKFIFSDYLFQVEDVIKNNPKKPISTSELITLIRPGGKILLNGFTVTATDESYQNLNAGEKYILFLKFVPETGAYQSVNPEGSFLTNDGKATTLNRSVASRFRGVQDLSSFIADIYSTISNNLPSSTKQGGQE